MFIYSETGELSITKNVLLKILVNSSFQLYITLRKITIILLYFNIFSVRLYLFIRCIKHLIT